MTKDAFLAELRKRLAGLPQDEMEERLAFYSEMIDDRMDDGATEEAAVEGIGTVDAVAEQIASEIPLSRLVGETVRRRKGLKGWEIALLILGAPLWFPLLMAALAVLLSLYIVIWALVISLWAVDLSLAAASLACLLSIVSYLEAGNTAGIIFSVGAAAVCAGLAVLMFHFCLWLSRAVVYLTGKALLAVKTRFVGKEA